MTGADDGYLRELAWNAIAPGFRSLPDVVEQLREWADDDPESGVTPDVAEQTVRALWARRQQELATEPARPPTDDRRVADAFTALAAAGLIAEMDCEYDQGEASEVCKELARQHHLGGYVFFHGQDTERLAAPQATLHLGFDAVPTGRRDGWGSREEYDAAAVAVGHRVAQAMVAHGLEVLWNGTAGARIQLPGLDWRRPLPPD